MQKAFVVPPEARKIVIASAAQKWREFKSRLTTLYIIPHKDEPDLLEFPPEDYNFIEKTHWDIFVADRLSEEFMVCKLHNNCLIFSSFKYMVLLIYMYMIYRKFVTPRRKNELRISTLIGCRVRDMLIWRLNW